MPTARGRRTREQGPVNTLSEAIDGEFAELERRRSALVEMRSALLRLRAVVVDDDEQAGAEPIPSEHVAGQVERLLAHTDGLVRSSILTVEAGPGAAEPMVRGLQERLAAGERQRALYAAGVAETPTGKQWMREWAACGEEQRVARTVPSEFAVYGSYAVVVTSRWADPSSEYAIIHNPMLVSAFITLFDTTYAAAAPVHASEDPTDVQLLELLGLGLKDEAIARYLGWGLRTVRRRVARLMDAHGVDTRYQLGVAVTASGLIDPTAGTVPPRRQASR